MPRINHVLRNPSTRLWLTLLFVVLVNSKLSAADDQKSAYEKLMSLAGTWSLLEDGKRFIDTFEVISRGNAVMERNIGFVIVYHFDHDSIVATLYTSDGNQPRLRATDFAQSSTTLRFEFVDAMNLRPSDSYISGLTLTFKSDTQLEERFRFIKDGTEREFSLVLTRQRARAAKPKK